jgi:hypothetical protein
MQDHLTCEDADKQEEEKVEKEIKVFFMLFKD